MLRLQQANLIVVAVVLTLVAARKSEEKCNEYAELVYENELSPVLRIGARFDVVSRCAIVETPLIVGGVKAKQGEFPHMAAIGFGKDDTSWQCGGTVISDNYVLTAAHCLQSSKGPAAKVRAGMTNLMNPDESMQERNVVDRIKHPKYNPPVKYHDIALLEVDEPFTLNSRLRPACLETEFHPAGESVLASGFGKTAYESDENSDDLMKVQLNYVTKENCEKSFAPDLGGPLMPDGLISSLLCAGVMDGGKDTCQGDSGGPLQTVLEDPYCMYSVVGVTSFGKFCAFKNSPAIYARVSSYLDWIEGIVWP